VARGKENLNLMELFLNKTAFLIDTSGQQCRCRSQWTRGLKRRSAGARSLELRVRIPPGALMFVCCDCCVMSGGGLYDGPITRPEGSH
jgi:hypothetical protein